MKNFFKKLLNSLIYLCQHTIQFIFNVYLVIFISNFGFRAKSKIVVKYYLYAFKYKSSRKFKKKVSNSSVFRKNNSKNRLNLSRFIVFNYFMFRKNKLKLKKKTFSNQNKGQKNFFLKKRLNLHLIYKNFYFLQIKLNSNLFNLKKSILLKKKFKKSINFKSKYNYIKNSRICLLTVLMNKSYKKKKKIYNILKNLKQNKYKINSTKKFLKIVIKSKKTKISQVCFKNILIKNKYKKKNNLFFNKYKKKKTILLRKDFFFFYYRLYCLYRFKFSIELFKLNLIRFQNQNKFKYNLHKSKRYNYNTLIKKNKNFSEFNFIKNSLFFFRLKYGRLNKKRFYRLLLNKKQSYLLIKKNTKNVNIKLNFMFYLQQKHLYKKRNSLAKFNIIARSETKKNKAVRSLFVKKNLNYSIKNKIQINYFLNLQKIRRRKYYSSLIRIYNFKLFLSYLRNNAKNKIKYYGKIKKNNNNVNFNITKKFLIFKSRKNFVKRKIKNFIFLENYLKISLFNFVFYRYLVLFFHKYLDKKFNLNMEMFMKIYIMQRIKVWALNIYKSKEVYKYIKNFDDKKEKKMIIKKLVLRGKNLKNSVNKLSPVIRIDNEIHASSVNDLNLAIFIMQLVHRQNFRYLKSKMEKINQKYNKFILKKTQTYISKEKKFLSFLEKKGILFFFNVYKNFIRYIYYLKKEERKNFKIKKKKMLFKKVYIKKKNKYKKYIIYKYFRKYFIIFNLKIKYSVNIWNMKNIDLFKEIYSNFILNIKKYLKLKNKETKSNYLKKTFGKKIKIYILKNNNKFKEIKKLSKMFLNSKISKNYFVKLKNKSQLKNFINITNKKVKKNRSEDLRIRNKKEILSKNKNYILHILYKKLIQVKKKKNINILSISKLKRYNNYYKSNIINKSNVKNKDVFIKKYYVQKIKQTKLFQYFFNLNFISKIVKTVNYFFNKISFHKKIKRKITYDVLVKKLNVLYKIKLFYKNMVFIFLNIRYKTIFYKYYRKIYLKFFIKIKDYKKFKIRKNINQNNLYFEKKYNDNLVKNIYNRKKNMEIFKSTLLLHLKIKKNEKKNHFCKIKKIKYRKTGYLFSLKLKNLRNCYNLQSMDIKDENSYFNLSKKRFSKNLKKSTFVDIEASNPFDLFRSFFFKKSSFFDSILFNDTLTFENNFRKKFTLEFLKSYDNRFDKEIPLDEFFFVDNCIQNKKVRGFYMAQPFTLPLLNILLNEKSYNSQKSINIGKSLNKLKNMNKKITDDNNFNIKNEKKEQLNFLIKQKNYETSNRNLLKSILYSTVQKYSDYESNHNSILKQKEFISYITFLFYEYEYKSNTNLDVFSLLGLVSKRRGVDSVVIDNFENRFKTKNSFEDKYSSIIEEDYGIRLDDKSINSEELFSSFSNKEEIFDFYNDLDVFKNIGKNQIFKKKEKNTEKISHKITSFFKNRKYKKENEIEFEDKIRRYYSNKIIKGSVLTDFDSFLLKENSKKSFFPLNIKSYFFCFFFRLLFYFYYYGVHFIINYFKIYFNLKNIANISEKLKISKEEKILWIQFLNIVYMMLQESYCNKTSFLEVKKNNFKYIKIVLQITLIGKNLNLQIEKIRTLELSLISNFSLLNLQRDFDKKFFFEELISMYNIEETDWFLMKDSLFYRKSSKNFKMLTSKSPYIERSLDVMLDKNKHLISLHKNENKEDKISNLIKNPKIFSRNTNESIQNLYDIFSHSVYKKMKSFRFNKTEERRLRSGYRINMEKRRKKKIIIKKKNLIKIDNILVSKKEKINRQKAKMKVFSNLISFFINSKRKNIYKKKKSVKNLLNEIKNIKIYKKKNNRQFYIRKKNLVKILHKGNQNSFSEKIFFLKKKIEKKTLQFSNNTYIKDMHNVRLKERNRKEIFNNKFKLNNKYYMNFSFFNKNSINEYISNDILNYQESYLIILRIISHYKKKYRKNLLIKNMNNDLILKISLKNYLKGFRLKSIKNSKLNRSRNIKMYYKYVSAKLYRRRLFFYLINKKKNEMEKRYYRHKIKSKWSNKFFYIDDDISKHVYLKKMLKKNQLFSKYYKKIKFNSSMNKNQEQNKFLIKLLKMSRSKYQSKIYDHSFVKEEEFNKYLSKSNEENEDINNIHLVNSRSKYVLSFNSDVIDLNFNKIEDSYENDLIEEKLHKYSNFSKGFYLFSNKYNNKRSKRMIFRNFYLKKIMYKNKFFDYRQIDRNKYILKKIEKTKYRMHHILKRNKKEIMASLNKRMNLKYFFVKKYFKSTFDLLIKYFTKLVYKRFVLKTNLMKIKFRIENYKFLTSKLNKYNKIFCSKMNLKKAFVKVILRRKLEKIVGLFLYRKKFSQFFSSKIRITLFKKVERKNLKQKFYLNNKFLNFYIRKERKNLKKIFSKIPLKLNNKTTFNQSKYYNMEISYYSKIRAIIKRNVLIKNQHNYSWNSLTQDSRSINFLLKSRSLNYNQTYRDIFRDKKEEYFNSRNFFQFKLPFVKNQEKYLVKTILEKFDKFYYNLWEKIELLSKNNIKQETKESYIEFSEKNESYEILFLQWFINLSNILKKTYKYITLSLFVLLNFGFMYILDFNVKSSICLSILFFGVFYPFYFVVFHYIFRIIKIGIKVYYLRYLKKKTISYSSNMYGFNKNKIKRFSVSFFVSSMRFFFCKRHYTRIFMVFLVNLIFIFKFLSFFLFIKIYIISLLFLFINFFFFNLKDSQKLYVKFVEFLIRILIFEIPWCLFYWIFSLVYIIDKYFFTIKIDKDYIQYNNKIEHFIATRIMSFLLSKTLLDIVDLDEKEIDFIFLKDFYKLDNMLLEKKFYVKYRSLLKI